MEHTIKKLLLLGGLLLLIMNCSSTDNENALIIEIYSKEDQSIPINFIATDLNGKHFLGSSLTGHVVLIDFWAVWYEPCIKAFPTINTIHNDFKDKNVKVLGIALNSGNVKDVNEFLKDYEYDYPFYVGDEELSQKFGIIGFPSYYLLDKNGNIFKKYVGEQLYDNVTRDIQYLLDQK